MNYKKDKIVKHKGEFIIVENSYTGLYDLYERVVLDNEKPNFDEMMDTYNKLKG